MINNLTVLAFIPARGGSKGLPRKNILELNGKPLISYTIEAANNCNLCDEIMVSTDSKEIANVARKFGAKTPFIRPKELAQDNSHMIDVIMHALEWYEEKNSKFDLFLYLQPTSPLRNTRHILDAFKVFFDKNADAIISVNESRSSPGRMNTLPADFSMNTFISKSNQYQNRQELPQYYELNGAVHIAKWSVLRRSKTWYVENSFGYVLKDPFWLDIDNKMDFEFAEFLLSKAYV